MDLIVYEGVIMFRNSIGIHTRNNEEVIFLYYAAVKVFFVNGYVLW